MSAGVTLVVNVPDDNDKCMLLRLPPAFATHAADTPVAVRRKAREVDGTDARRPNNVRVGTVQYEETRTVEYSDSDSGWCVVAISVASDGSVVESRDVTHHLHFERLAAPPNYVVASSRPLPKRGGPSAPER
jgi:hypothetical protein